MKMVKLFARLFLFLIIILSTVSCKKDLSTGSDFLIRVDSINVPGVVNSETSFDIIFYGTIGFTGCISFKTFNMVINNDEYVIEAWATYDQNDNTCPDVLVSMNGKKLSLIIPNPGTYFIVIREPDGYIINRKITVN